MATFQSGLVQDHKNLFRPYPGGTVGYREAVIDVPASVSGGDIFELIPVFDGERVVDLKTVVTDLDSATAIVLDIGDRDSATRFVDGDTTARTGGVIEVGSGLNGAALLGAMGFYYTADNALIVTVATAPGTGVAGQIKMAALIANG